MKIGRPVAFVVLAFMIGAIISQGSFAFADDSATNPFRAIWEAIGELQTRTDSLQAQIDDIKTNGVEASEEQLDAKVSETSLAIDVGGGDAGQTVISVVATNTGPESAVGVKVLTYYQMSLLDVYFIDGAKCTDQARGIIECYVGTIEPGGAAQITIDATPLQLGEQAIITADVSSITEDSDPANNHAEAVFITSEAPVVLPPQEEEEEPVEEQPASSGGSSEQPSEQGSEAPAEQPGEETPSEQPAENEQGSEEQAGEQTGQEGSEEQSSGEESSESGEQSSEGGEQSGSEGGESSGDAGSSEGSAGEGSSDSGSDSGSSDSGDSGSGDSSSGDSGSSDSGGDSGSEGSSSDGGSSDGGSDGGSDSGGDSGGDSGSSGGESTG